MIRSSDQETEEKTRAVNDEKRGDWGLGRG